MDNLMNSIKLAEPIKDDFNSKVIYPKYLFHRTNEDNLKRILLTNKLIAGTRSDHEDVRVSMSIKINRDEFGPVALVIDADKLRCDYLVKEFDYDKSMGQYGYEAEWYTDVDITNLNKYIVDITSDYDESHDKLYHYDTINKAIKKILELPNIEIE